MMQAATTVQKRTEIVCSQDRHTNKSSAQADFPRCIDDLGVPPLNNAIK